MKKIALALLMLGFIRDLYAQILHTKQSAVPLIQQREIYLNGGARASVGGKSRELIKIDLPENTVKWYYSFSTSSEETGTKNLNLALQLTNLLGTGE